MTPPQPRPVILKKLPMCLHRPSPPPLLHSPPSRTILCLAAGERYRLRDAHRTQEPTLPAPLPLQLPVCHPNLAHRGQLSPSTPSPRNLLTPASASVSWRKKSLSTTHWRPTYLLLPHQPLPGSALAAPWPTKAAQRSARPADRQGVVLTSST